MNSPTSTAIVVASFLFSSGCAQELQPFASDGCSSFPDGTLEIRTLWLSCCTAHDSAYWQGGSYAERLQADQDLRSCVAQTGQPEIAKLMLAGVRVGGTPYLPTSFRWGYGWPYPRGYKSLTEAERQMVQSKIEAQERTDNETQQSED